MLHITLLGIKSDMPMAQNPLLANISVGYSAGDKQTNLCMINSLGGITHFSMIPRILVHLSMNLEQSGGRHGPFTEGYRPHFVVDGGEWLGVTATHCPGPVAPGDEADVEFELVYHPKVDYSALTVGAEFAVHEGPRVVASGKVIERYDHAA